VFILVRPSKMNSKSSFDLFPQNLGSFVPLDMMGFIDLARHLSPHTSPKTIGRSDPCRFSLNTRYPSFSILLSRHPVPPPRLYRHRVRVISFCKRYERDIFPLSPSISRVRFYRCQPVTIPFLERCSMNPKRSLIIFLDPVVLPPRTP